MNTQNTQPTYIKGKDIIGLKVVTLQRGKIIEDIDELVYDPKEHRVKALVVDPGGWFSGAKVILFEDIKAFGKDAIIVESDKVIKKASDIPEQIQRIIKEGSYLNANRVMTDDGAQLGKISDIYFDPLTGKVVEYEISQGVLKNAQSGKKLVQVSDVIRTGEDVLIVKGHAQEEVGKQAQQQGLQGALSTAKTKTPDVLEQTKQKLAEIGQAAKIKGEELTEKTKQQTMETKDTVRSKTREETTKIEENRKKNALGKYVTVNILSTNDQILAKRGTMITNKLLEQAQQEGMLEQVLSNISSQPLDILEGEHSHHDNVK